jgi:organic radical activating enzyme
MSENKILLFRDKLNAISPSFCAAKWNQVTLHLQTGHNHSCHHPTTHKIPLDELAESPSALHNTHFKKLQRKKMLEGVRPKECDYCWRIEDSSPDAISDRTYKSSEPWARPYIDTIKDMPWDANVAPTYLEVSFSSVCNFKCSYCSPEVSSKWMEEIERHGPYPTSNQFGNIQWLEHKNAMPIPHNQPNPYVDAFWKWWPEIYTTLEQFRITGGEPLMTKDTFKVLDYVIEHPNPNLVLSINSNMGVPDSLLDKFIEKIQIICNENKVKQFKIFTSCDAYGKQADYIRHGLDYTKWLSNIRKVLDTVPNCTFTIMSTYNALSVSSYIPFMQDVLDMKMEYANHLTQHAPMILDTPYLRYPEHQAIFILPRKELQERLYEQTTFMYKNLQYANWMGTANRGFFQWEADKFKRIYELVMHDVDVPNAPITKYQKDFVAFVDEHDKRRSTNFLDTFPEMGETYYKWKNGTT